MSLPMNLFTLLVSHPFRLSRVLLQQFLNLSAVHLYRCPGLLDRLVEALQFSIGLYDTLTAVYTLQNCCYFFNQRNR